VTRSSVTPPVDVLPPPAPSFRAPAAQAPPAQFEAQPETRTALQPAEQTAISGQVWVNTNSSIYHYPGARWYGNTKEGAYMSESQAVAQGYRAAQNGQ
jgi:hypothetical protein